MFVYESKDGPFTIEVGMKVIVECKGRYDKYCQEYVLKALYTTERYCVLLDEEDGLALTFYDYDMLGTAPDEEAYDYRIVGVK